MQWLLLRGLSRDQRHWGDFPRVFRDRVDTKGIHFLDSPGTGTEHRRRAPSSIREMVEDLRARWLPLRDRNEGAWGIVGPSLGGMLTMQWCADHPDDFARAVLINTSAANLSVPWRRLDVRVLPDMVRAMTSRDRLARQRRILRMTTRMVDDVDAVAERWAELQDDAPVARLTVLRQIWASSRFRAPERLKPTVLVLAGAKDPLCDPSCPSRLAERFAAPLEVHPHAGHDLPLDAPEWVADRIAAWVNSAAERMASVTA